MSIKLAKPVILTVIFLCIFGLAGVHAQRDYKTGIGFRAGPLAGLSAKQFISNKNALELIYSAKWNGTIFEGLYEIHHDFFKSESFNFYYGGGAHFGHWNLDQPDHPWFATGGAHSTFGIDGIVGLEYCFSEAPISVSMDWKPMLNLINYSGFWMNDIGLTIRYDIFK